MKLYTSRNKLVTFRLTDNEYCAIRDLCVAKGFRSVSELTRESLLQQLSDERRPRGLVTGDLVSLVTGLERIDEALKDLSGQIAQVLGHSRSEISIGTDKKSITKELRRETN